MSTPAFEAFLARLYTDAAARARFLAAPEAEARRAGLSPDQCHSLAAIDRTGLEMAARSLAHKRAAGKAVGTGRRAGLPVPFVP